MTLVTPDEADVSRHWTVDDLAYLPDDGNRYELLNGELIVSPAPIPLHQDAVFEIGVLLRAACPPDVKVYVSPIDYQISFDTSLQPDVVVIPRAGLDRLKPLKTPALLVVEVISKSSKTTDLERKPPAYARSGVDHYWTFDPLNAYFVARRWRGDRYVEVATASEDERIRLDEPFPVEICPAEIIGE